MKTRISLVVGVASLLAACQPELDKVTVTLLTDPPLEVTVADDQITIPEGIAIGVDIVGFDQDGEDIGKLIVMTAENGKGEVAPINDEEEATSYIVSGDEVGSYTILVSPEYGSGELQLKVEVVPQPAD